MTTISANLQAVRARVSAAAHAAGRDAAAVGLVAVSKTWPAAAVAEAAACGQRAFGENYAQEGVQKVRELTGLGLEWHFIGPLQSNKTQLVAEHFDWVHGLEREKIAARLSAQRPAGLAPLQVCIQVNLGLEAGKSGVAPADVQALARAVAKLPGLRLRGLMCIPEATDNTELLARRFGELAALRNALNAEGYALDTLSMGMSQDFELAIACGATLVRVGSAIFGSRARSPGSAREKDRT
ncbi:MAG: YggS family pyridoxal phosphate-dependent enzyme [Rhodocyclaceae bacterium]|nr:YggS family pyridoxal phosphate-dependent enzyme [Rhodocyclaceae bacterium]MBX3668803.1 YggS family pyridoxal phosphate-dependent enzyme [Rhodocyclaceae bacterium]